jgi:hypothetical protein
MAPVRAQRASDLSIKRLTLAHRAADEAAHILDRFRAPTITRRVNGRTGRTETIREVLPNAAQVRDYGVAFGILFTKVSEALSTSDPSEGKGAIIALFDLMQNQVAAEDEANAARHQIIDQQ